MKTARNCWLFCAVVLFLSLNTIHARAASASGQPDPAVHPACDLGDHSSTAPALVLAPGDVTYTVTPPGAPLAPAPGQPALAAAPSDTLAQAPALPGPPTVVNVLFIYSAAAQAAITNTSIDALIDLAVGQVNGIFQSSLINVQLNAVYKGLVAHAETNDLTLVLDRMRAPNDGYLDGIFALRLQYQADLVVMVTAIGQFGGYAAIMSTPRLAFREQSFSVVRAAGLQDGGFTLAHEVSHAFGCNHDRANSFGTGAFSYSYAHNLTDPDGLVLGTIASFTFPQVPFFSNPQVLYRGVPTGLAEGATNSADCARTINQTAPLVAQFRTAPPPPPPNDNFNNRIALTGASLTVTGYNESATKELSEPTHIPGGTDYASVWYSWTAPGAGEVTIDTFGSDFNTTLAAYTGPLIGYLTQITFNDNSPGGPFFSQVASKIVFPTEAGTAYQVAVDGLNRDEGTVLLNINYLPFGTVPATSVTATNAVLNGLIAAAANATNAFFQWGLTAAYGNSTPSQTLVAGSTNIHFSRTITGLSYGTTYHFRLVTLTTNGTSNGSDMIFTTPSPPALAVSPASLVTANSATLSATVNPNGDTTTSYFQWGPTIAYGYLTVATNMGNGTNAAALSATLNGLLPGATYHFRALAANSIGSTNGPDQAFTCASGPGTALQFDGTNDFVEVPDSPSLGLSGLMTVEAWVRRAATGVQHSIVEKYGCAGSAPTFGGYAFRIGSTDKLNFYTLDNCNDGTGAFGGTSLQANVWYHVAGVFDGHQIRVYVNGVLDGSTGTERNPKPGNTPLRIGARGNDLGTGFAGVLEEVRLWNVARSAAEIQATMNRRLLGNEAGLAGYWRFDEGNGLTAYDASPNYNNGTLTNGPIWVPSTAPLIGVPTVIAASATGLTPSTATLNGSVVPNRDATTAWFEWGGTTAYGYTTAPQNAGSGTNSFALTAALTGLMPAVSWHFRIVGFNSSGTNYSADAGFFTPSPPVSATLAAGNVTGMSATINGSVNPNGDVTTALFQWGTTAGYGNLTPGQNLGGGSTAQPLAQALTGLSPGTTYHYRVLAYNGSGTNFGADATFSTPPPPVAATQPASGISSSGATLNGSANPSGDATTTCFQWGTTSSYGNITTVQNAGNGTSAVPLTQGLSGLSAGTTYHFRLVAVNSAGTNFGANATFITLNLPAAATQPASGISGNAATLNGTVNPNGAGPATAWFQWGATTGYGNTSAAQTMANGANPVPVSAALTGLTPGATYHFRVAASNTVGLALGSDQAVTLPVGAGSALQFDGVDDYVTVPDSASIHITGPITLEAWVRRAATGTQHSIAEKYGCPGSAPTYGGYAFRISSADKLIFYTLDDCNGGSAAFGATSLQSNTWYHVAALWDGTQIRIYLNGVLDGQTSTTRNPKLGNTPLRIGARGNDLGTPFAGVMDEMRLWNVARSVAELQTNMNHRLNGNEPGLAAYWRFDDGSGPAAGDTTTNGNTASLVNGPVWVASTAPIMGSLLVGTDPAGGVSATAATLKGNVNPNGDATTAFFQWGSTSAYGNATASQNLGNASTTLAVAQPIAGLSAGTTYHYRLVAFNATSGTNMGVDVTFTTPGPPSATTLAASAITANSAALNGSANPNGDATTAYFQWGATAGYGNVTASQALGSGTSVVPAASAVSGLTPGSTYHFRLVAYNASGTNYGADTTFTTPTPSSVVTQPATAISGTGATLNGSANPNGSATTVYFQWGATTGYGNVTGSQNLGSGASSVAVNSALNGLLSGTTYHYRLAAVNAGGTNYGSDAAFATPPPPAVATQPASGVSASAATLNGSANPNGDSAQALFQWGTNTAYGNSTVLQNLGGGSSSITVAQPLSGLVSGRTYHFRLVAFNSAGTNFGANTIFTTPLLPAAVTLAASGTTGSGATLNGTVNPNGSPATVRFEWGPSTSYNQSTPAQSLASGGSDVPVTGALSGLTAGATYHYRMTASNSVGVSYGVDQAFSTLPLGAGSALLFDGDNDYLSVADSASVRITGPITIEAWIRRSVAGVQHSIVEKYGCPGAAAAVGGYAFRVGSNDKLILWTLDDCNGGVNAAGGTSLQANTWYHVAGVFDGSAIRVYVNGVLDGVSTTTHNPKTGNTPLRIGARGNDVAAGFNGVIDDVRLWNVARTPTQIAQNMSQRLTGSEAGLAANWQCDEGSGLTASDATANGNTATLMNGPLWVASSASIGTLAVTTYPASGVDAATATLNGLVNPGGDATTIYFEWGTTTGYGNATALQNVGSGSGSLAVTQSISGLAIATTYHARLAGFNATSGTNYGSDVSFTTLSPPSPVTQPATGLAANAATLNGFVNPNGGATTAYFEWGPGTNFANRTASQNAGSGLTSVTALQPISGLAAGTTYGFRLVAFNSAGTNFGAALSFVTPALPSALTQPPSGITASGATMNGTVNPNGFGTTAYFEWGTSVAYGNITAATGVGGGTSAVPVTNALSGLSSGVSYHYRVVATNTFGAATGADQIITMPSSAGSALQFDGVNDYVTVPDSLSLRITGPISVEAWIKRTATGVQHSILEKYGCAGAAATVGGYAFRVGVNDKLVFWLLDDCNTGSAGFGNTALPADTWVHVAGTFDGSTIRIYLNGVLDGSAPSSRSPATGNTPLRLGARGNDLATPFAGVLDEVRLWSVARTTAEIQATMNRQLNGSEPGLAGYWRFDEGAGLTAGDTSLSSGGNIGTLMNGPIWVASAAPLGTGAVQGPAAITDPIGPEPEFPPHLSLSIASDASNDLCQIQIKGEPGFVQVLEVSCDLTNWIPLTTYTNKTGSFQYQHRMEQTVPCRFFRVREKP